MRASEGEVINIHTNEEEWWGGVEEGWSVVEGGSGVDVTHH
jgi:hypothetical protein